MGRLIDPAVQKIYTYRRAEKSNCKTAFMATTEAYKDDACRSDGFRGGFPWAKTITKTQSPVLNPASILLHNG